MQESSAAARIADDENGLSDLYFFIIRKQNLIDQPRD
jgi:hypothetical protein